MGFGKDGKGVIITDDDIITLSTLANNASIKQSAPPAITEDFRMIKMELSATLVGNTSTENPIDLYLVNDELTVAEIAASISGPGPLGRSDRGGQELAERAIFLLGTFAGVDANLPLKGADGQEGVINKTVRWTFSDAQGWAIAAHNRSGGTLTTGSVIRLATKFFGVWLV